ncbi:MAG: hypothetical protein OEY27_08590 [Gammaproteobacteria bacterium]|nr:hypothetical protein [Gammaproteobacteria bacterium]
MTTASGGKGFKIGRAVVVVVDDLGNPVANATVSGVFSGDINQSVTGSTPTNTSGSTTIDSTQAVKNVRILSFCVTSITHSTLQNFSAPPGAVCGAL